MSLDKKLSHIQQSEPQMPTISNINMDDIMFELKKKIAEEKSKTI